MKIALYIVFTIVFVGISVFAWAYIKVSRAEKEKTELEYFVEQNSIDSALQVFIAQFPVNTQIAVAHIQKGNVVFCGYARPKTTILVGEPVWGAGVGGYANLSLRVGCSLSDSTNRRP